ncbi:Coenzyme F420 hydrogenase/dehydrogenase, beta subunit C-terminal domain [Agromyces agglutinans]|uniref:Coenzyme F420 hydrogenase/dehydrogenase, beta subunit C-terminal domain n=1 Tax=Agromyces agglutinans TaxID=2662258 RepID=UPI0015620416|nr:Coenzyme F420 hydrogenase/dehydrogenase, beta subunit C-terminal domain [Agromyces agglutinans]
MRVTLNTNRLYTASLGDATSDQIRAASRVCPFSDDAVDEDALGAPHPSVGARTDRRIGTYTRTLVGSVASETERVKSSSGGMTSWMLAKLIDEGLVDAIVHVGRTASAPELFEFTVSRSEREIEERRKSQYYATTFAEVFQTILGEDIRVAVVGIPCFIKAARLLCREDERFATRITMFVGLVCGHLKSQFFAEALAWQAGVAPSELSRVDFRVKNSERSAGDYDFGAWRENDAEPSRQRTRSLIGGMWGHCAFQPEACNFCDDIFAETADIVFGDAWLPEYSADWRGTNVIVSRNEALDAILEAGMSSGEILVEDVGPDKVAHSQAGNFRHRRDGLAVRLADDIAAGKTVPKKRVEPDAHRVDRRRRRLIRQRRRMAALSFTWFAEARSSGDLSRFVAPMRREIAKYDRIAVPPWKTLAGAPAKLFARFARLVSARQAVMRERRD